MIQLYIAYICNSQLKSNIYDIVYKADTLSRLFYSNQGDDHVCNACLIHYRNKSRTGNLRVFYFRLEKISTTLTIRRRKKEFFSFFHSLFFLLTIAS